MLMQSGGLSAAEGRESERGRYQEKERGTTSKRLLKKKKTRRFLLC
jgi:hypothetical protein